VFAAMSAFWTPLKPLTELTSRLYIKTLLYWFFMFLGCSPRAVAVLRGVWVGHCPPQIFGWPSACPPVLFLISR